MKKLFDGFGSDKSLAHDYHIPYGQLFGLVPLGAILEIGIGSVNPEYPGNMGSRGHPGASQAAFRDSGFFTHVFGADIDRSILTNSPGITNFFVDQTDAGSLTNLRNEPFGTEISLIIDDGLHQAEANLRTLEHLFPLLRSRGYYVIEDLSGEEFHKVLSAVGRERKYHNFSIWLNRGRFVECHLVVIQKD